ncbi:DUF3139 domain-containing protein [Brochothrix thermosphacta]|uniref:DUF3139 domain-containing protein n=1 Tax=Brochothrix thermosphacta TaxID=2756 RepID=UPI000D7A53BC|nr:DUF3139 domain-containing protein [Brochothrix thermosphacta]SPN74373.1 conserved hypothetical protein [Brochothrix thermosphacta]
MNKKTILLGTILLILTSLYLYLIPYYKYQADSEIEKYMQKQGISEDKISKKTPLEKNWKYGWYSCTVSFSDDPDVVYTYMYSRSYDAGKIGTHLETFGTYDKNKKPKYPPLKNDSQETKYLE